MSTRGLTLLTIKGRGFCFQVSSALAWIALLPWRMSILHPNCCHPIYNLATNIAISPWHNFNVTYIEIIINAVEEILISHKLVIKKVLYMARCKCLPIETEVSMKNKLINSILLYSERFMHKYWNFWQLCKNNFHVWYILPFFINFSVVNYIYICLH